MGGVIVLLFIVYHLLHLTVGAPVAGYEIVHGKVYDNVVNGFSNPAIAGFYIVAQACLGLHLFHGTWSLMQTLGLNHDKYNATRRKIATGVSLLITVGNISIPVAVLADCSAKEVIVELRSNAPSGPIETAWDRHRFDMKLVNPANKRKFSVLVVGTGLAGASASATMAELGYHVKAFCYQDSPRRAHSIAAQGGINAAKNYQGDGDSVYRLFYDTVKGGFSLS